LFTSTMKNRRCGGRRPGTAGPGSRFIPDRLLPTTT